MASLLPLWRAILVFLGVSAFMLIMLFSEEVYYQSMRMACVSAMCDTFSLFTLSYPALESRQFK